MKVNWRWTNKMTSVNIRLPGFSELKFTGMDEFNSDDHSKARQFIQMHIYINTGIEIKPHVPQLFQNRK